MPLVKLKEISQDTWLHSGGGPSRGGVCYYMCNFIESSLGIWNKPGTFANAVTSAKNFAQGTAMMNYAKAQSLKKAPQTIGYTALNGAALQQNKIYRAWLHVESKTAPTTDNTPNHEIMIITGSGNDVIYFEPNFGFFQVSDPTMNNTQAVEFFIKQQYGATYDVRNFGYLSVRAITTDKPLSFTSL